MEMYKHNLEAYASMQESFKTSNKTAIIHPTGTGKMYIFLKWLIDHPNETFLFLAPTSAIMYQLQYTIESNGYKLSDFPNLKCALYCQLLNWNTEDFHVSYDNIVLDEFHRAGAPKWGKAVKYLLENNKDSKVLGLSATPTRYVDHKNMADILFEGNIASEITLAEAMAKGILPLPMYINTIYSLEEQIKELEDKVKKVREKSKRLKLEELLQKAKSYLLQVEGLDKIFEKHLTKKDGKYLLFCKDIKHLEEIKGKINEWFRGINEEIEIYDIHSKHRDEENERTLRRFRKDESHKLKLLLSVEMLNEGLHVEDIDGVIMLRPTSSHIVYLQQIGRGLSIHSKKPLIIDIVNNIECYQNIYDIREEIEEIIRSNPSECISQEELEEQFRIIDYVQDVMRTLQEVDNSFRFTNKQKLAIIQSYLKEGHEYSNIKQSTKDAEGHPIGTWISQWRCGVIQLTEEERNILISMGETFDRKYLTNQQKLVILQVYLNDGHEYSNIKFSTKDAEGHPIGTWINKWRCEKIQLTEEERNILISLGETFDRKYLTNQQKLVILQVYLNDGHEYSNIKCSTKDSEGHPIGVWINQWCCGVIQLTKEERNILISLGETFDRKYLTNQQKLVILQVYLNDGHEYSNIKCSTKDSEGHPIGTWVSQWRCEKIQLTEEERNILISLGETFDRKCLTNQQKLVILQVYLNEGHEYSNIKFSTKDAEGHPIGAWINQWRCERIQLTEAEQNILISMGETFEQKRAVSLMNPEKLTIIQSYLNEGHEYSNIKFSTKDAEGHPIGVWINQWRCEKIQLTEEERNILISMGETFEQKRAVSLMNPEKLTIIQSYLNEGREYSNIKFSTKDSEGHPIGVWINQWRCEKIQLTEEERNILISLGETFEPKRVKKVSVYPTAIEIESPSLDKQNIRESSKTKRKHL